MIRNSKAERGKCPINENRDQDILVSVSLKENRKALASDRKPVNNESSKSTATQIKRAFIESPLTKTNPIKIGRYYTTNEAGGVSASLSDYELALIETYNRFCDTKIGRGFLKVDQITYSVRGLY